MTTKDARNSLGLNSRLTLCVMGGSQGAKSINCTTVELLKEFSQELNYQLQLLNDKIKVANDLFKSIL